MNAEHALQRGTWYAADEELSLQLIRRLLEDPPPTPSIAGWLYPGSTCTVFGEPDAGKSMLLAASTYRIVKDGGEVLWVDYEMGEPRVVRRLLAFGLTPQEIAKSVRRVHYPSGIPGHELLDAYAGIDAAFFDGFTGLLGATGGSSNSDTDIDNVYSLILRPMSASGTAVLSLDHVTKDKENRGRWAIGSQRKIGAPDSAYVFDVVSKFKPGYGGKARLKSSRDRDGVLDVIEYTLTGDMTWRLEDASLGDSTMRYTGFMERISIYLEGASDKPSGADIERDIKGNNTARREALRALINEGYVEVGKGAHGALAHTSKKAYRESTDKGSSPTSPILASSSPKASTKSSSPTSPTPSYGEGEVASDFQGQNGKHPEPARPQPEFTFTDDASNHDWGTFTPEEDDTE